MQGYLWKKGQLRRNWKERWFTLRPSNLSYYTGEDRKECQGNIALDGNCCVEVSSWRSSNAFNTKRTAAFYSKICFCFIFPRKTGISLFCLLEHSSQNMFLCSRGSQTVGGDSPRFYKMIYKVHTRVQWVCTFYESLI